MSQFADESDRGIAEEIRKGFSGLSADLKGALKGADSGLSRLSSDVKYGGSVLGGATRRIKHGVGTAFGFIGETFSSEFNKPSRFARDLYYLNSNKTPRDMSREQAKYYAQEHMNQRLDTFGNFVAKDLAMWSSLGYLPGWERGVGNSKDFYAWKNITDRSSKHFITGMNSSNRLTGTGWSDSEASNVASFHQDFALSNKTFSQDEQQSITDISSQLGYFNKTSSVQEYKKKYKELIDGTKEIMKTLHASMEEGVQMMSSLSSMKIDNKPGFIKNVGIAAANSGYSSQQILQYAGMTSDNFYSQGFSKKFGAEIAVEAIKSGGQQLRLGSVGKFLSGDINKAAFMNKDMTFNEDLYKSLLSGKSSYSDIMEPGMSNLADFSSSPEKADLFALSAEKVMEAGMGPEGIARMAPMIEYDRFKYQRQDMYDSEQGFYNAYRSMRKTRDNLNEEELKDLDKSIKGIGTINYELEGRRAENEETNSIRLSGKWNKAKTAYGFVSGSVSSLVAAGRIMFDKFKVATDDDIHGLGIIDANQDYKKISKKFGLSKSEAVDQYDYAAGREGRFDAIHRTSNKAKWAISLMDRVSVHNEWTDFNNNEFSAAKGKGGHLDEVKDALEGVTIRSDSVDWASNLTDLYNKYGNTDELNQSISYYLNENGFSGVSFSGFNLKDGMSSHAMDKYRKSFMLGSSLLTENILADKVGADQAKVISNKVLTSPILDDFSGKEYRYSDGSVNREKIKQKVLADAESFGINGYSVGPEGMQDQLSNIISRQISGFVDAKVIGKESKEGEPLTKEELDSRMKEDVSGSYSTEAMEKMVDTIWLQTDAMRKIRDSLADLSTKIGK